MYIIDAIEYSAIFFVKISIDLSVENSEFKAPKRDSSPVEPNNELTKSVLKDLLRSSNRRITIDEIQNKVSNYYNLKIEDLTSSRRIRSFARPRQVAMYLSKKLTTRSLPEIGRKFGGRDHTTVIHAVKKIEQLKEENSKFDEDINLITQIITSA